MIVCVLGIREGLEGGGGGIKRGKGRTDAEIELHAQSGDEEKAEGGGDVLLGVIYTYVSVSSLLLGERRDV